MTLAGMDQPAAFTGVDAGDTASVIAPRAIADLDEHDLTVPGLGESQRRVREKERYAWFLALALALLVADGALDAGRRGASREAAEGRAHA